MRRAKKGDRKLISLAGANTISSNEWHFSASCYEACSQRKELKSSTDYREGLESGQRHKIGENSLLSSKGTTVYGID